MVIATAAAPESLQGRTLLVVEDEYFLADDMVQGLEATGAAVVGPAGSIKDALALIEGTAHLDGAVLDLNLRGELAYPVADALRARGVPFVFATGYDKASIPEGYSDVTRCEKPVDPPLVARALFG